MQPRVWDALAALTQLRHLAVDMAVEQLPQLARLPAGLSALKVHVAGNRIEEDVFVWDGDEDDAYEACTVLAAAARAPGLRMLRVHAFGGALSSAGLAELISARTFSAKHLKIDWPPMSLHDVCARHDSRAAAAFCFPRAWRRPCERRLLAPGRAARVQGAGGCFCGGGWRRLRAWGMVTHAPVLTARASSLQLR